MKIKILESAVQDIQDGFQFYEHQRKGLGENFMDSLFSDIESLKIHGGAHAKRFGFHRMLATNFPFSIYYKVNEETNFVYAVLDCRRKPNWIRNRLK